MKNILIINPFTGKIGPNTFLLYITKYLSDNDYNITLIYPKCDEIIENIKPRFDKIFFLRYIELKPVKYIYKKLFIRFFSEFKLFLFLSKLLINNKYNFVIVNTEIYSFSSLPLFLSTKVLAVVHTLNFSNYSILNKIVLKIQNSFVSEYISVSNTVSKQLLLEGITKPISILHNVVENPIRVISHPKRNGNLIITCVCYPIISKGAHHLIEIIKRVISYNDKVIFVVIGWHSDIVDVDFKNKIERKILDYNLSRFIHLESLVDSVFPHVAQSDIFIQISENEAFGIVVAEAMSCKVPVISFNVGALHEVIDSNVNGFLIEPFNIQEFSQKILYLIDNHDSRVEFGENGYNKVKNHFSYSSFSRKLNTLIEKY